MYLNVPTIKIVAAYLSATGGATVVTTAIKAYVPTSGLLNKTLVGIGGFTLAGAAGTAAAKYTTDTIDGIATMIEATKTR